MTEEQWLTSDHPYPMLAWLRDKTHPMLECLQGKVIDRKARLFSVACCRRLWDWMIEPTWREGVEMAERHADGEGSKKKMQRHRRAIESAPDLPPPPSPEYRALLAASECLVADGLGGACYLSGLVAVSYATQAGLLRDLFGNLFRPASIDPAWRTPAVVWLAQAAHDERALPSGELEPARLAVLADALEEADCTDDILSHLRGPGPHVRGCWALDLILGKL